MKKIISFILVLCITAVFLPGCSGSDGSAEGESLKSGVTLESVVEQIDTEIGIPMAGEVTDAELEDIFHIKKDDVESYYIKYALVNVSCANVAAVKAKPGKAEQIKTALETRKQDVEASFEMYLPEQYDIAKAGKVLVKGDYVFLLIIEDAEKAESIVNESFN